MSYNVYLTHRFEKELKRLVKKHPSIKQDFRQLIESLEENPILGFSLGKNCYKIRMAISSKGKGKSGGSRIISYVYFENEVVYLLTIYDKNEKADLKTNELKEMIESLDL